MEQDLEMKVQERTKTPDFDTALELVRRNPEYCQLAETEQEAMAKTAVDDPALFNALRHGAPRRTEVHVLDQLNALEQTMEGIRGEFENELTPENPREFYTPEERKELQRRQRMDKYVGWVIGGERAAELEATLQPVVRERYTKHMMKLANWGAKSAEELEHTITHLNRSSIDKLYDQRYQAKEGGSKISFAKNRIPKLTGEIKELDERINAYDQADAAGLSALRAERQEKEDQRIVYTKSLRDSTRAVLGIKKELQREQEWQGLYATMVGQLQNLSMEMQLAHDDLERQLEGPQSQIDPGKIGEVVHAYTRVRSLASKLEGIWRNGTPRIEDAWPDTFTPDPLKEANQQRIQKSNRKSYAAAQQQREQEALDFIDKVDQIQPYL